MRKWMAGLCALFLLLAGCSPTAEPSDTPLPTEEETVVSDTMDKVERLMAMRDLDEIFALEDDTDFATALSSALCDWTNYGEHLELLSPEAQVFYLCGQLDSEINSNGFVGFIFESYGQWAPETVDALETIGAPQTADILRRAIALLPDGVCPRDHTQREGLLFEDEDKYYTAYNALDEEFYAYPDGVLTDLYVAYARDHRDCFSEPEQKAPLPHEEI